MTLNPGCWAEPRALHSRPGLPEFTERLHWLIFVKMPQEPLQYAGVRVAHLEQGPGKKGSEGISVSAWRSPKAPRSSKVSESRGKRKGQGRRDEGHLGDTWTLRFAVLTRSNSSRVPPAAALAELRDNAESPHPPWPGATSKSPQSLNFICQGASPHPVLKHLL